MKRPRNIEVPKIETVDEVDFVKDENAGEVEIKAVEKPVEPAVIEVVPGKKVKVEGRDGEFIISQKLKDGKVSVLGDNGLILFVKPGQLKNIK